MEGVIDFRLGEQTNWESEERSREAAAPRVVLAPLFAVLSVAECGDFVSGSLPLKSSEMRGTELVLFDRECRESCLLFFPLCSHQKARRRRDRRSHPNSRFRFSLSLSKKNNPTSPLAGLLGLVLRVHGHLPRRVLPRHLYGEHGVEELGKYQVRKKEREVKKGLGEEITCLLSRREGEIFFVSLSALSVWRAPLINGSSRAELPSFFRRQPAPIRLFPVQTRASIVSCHRRGWQGLGERARRGARGAGQRRTNSILFFSWSERGSESGKAESKQLFFFSSLASLPPSALLHASLASRQKRLSSLNGSSRLENISSLLLFSPKFFS